MALSLHNYFLLALLPFLLFSHKAIWPMSTSHHGYDELKSLHFTLFQQETINKTLYMITKGVAGTNITESTASFGAMFVFEDPLTLAPNRTSEVVGTAQGTSTASSLDGLSTISITKMTLRIKNHTGSVSVVGGPHNVKPSDQPIVGGTDDFLFAQGYVTSSVVHFAGLTYVYKIEFHIYWPPYAK